MAVGNQISSGFKIKSYDFRYETASTFMTYIFLFRKHLVR
jgi:hypothetical protein